MVFHCRINFPRKENLKSSHLRYAAKTYTQYQVTVKLLGSFRLTAGNRHLHRYCIFTGQIPETVAQSLHHSCASELTWQGISLNYSSKLDSLLALSLQRRAHDVGLSLIMIGLICISTYQVAGSVLNLINCLSFSTTVLVLENSSFDKFSTLGPL